MLPQCPEALGRWVGVARKSPHLKRAIQCPRHNVAVQEGGNAFDRAFVPTLRATQRPEAPTTRNIPYLQRKVSPVRVLVVCNDVPVRKNCNAGDTGRAEALTTRNVPHPELVARPQHDVAIW